MPMRTTGAVALLALGALVPAACGGGSSSPSAPKVAAPAVARAASFRVVYKVTDTAGPQTQISTDILQVEEPWNARLEHRDGPPPGGIVTSSTVQNERFTFSTAVTAQGFAVRRVPGPLTQAPSPEALQAAAAAGIVDRAGDDTVAGEPCTRWIYKATNEVLAKGTPDEHTESCVTGDGVPLRESITLQGRLVRVSEAVQVDRHPPVTP